MPTYAYTCRDCGTALEVVQAFTDDALTVCPTCGGHLRKQYGSIGVTFNGSGFYRTDSRTGTASGADGAAKPPAEGGAKPASTEAAPAATAPAKSTPATPTPS